MAQVTDDGGGWAARVRMAARQRPAAALVAVLVLALLGGAGVFGVMQAQEVDGVLIERADGDVDEDDAEDEATTLVDADDDADDDDDDESDTIVVDVSGAVVSPCVVELPAGSRVQDAIEAAGGLTEDADIASLNRAAVLTDGQKVHVPVEGEDVSATTSDSSTSSSASATSSLVNINTADADELDTLPGIGPALAQAIIDDREANGAFTSPEDIMRVSGIGEAKYANLKDLICV